MRYHAMRHPKWLRGLLTTALISGLVATPGMAQAEGLYVGLGFGNTAVKNDTTCSDLDGLFNPGFSCSSDDKDTGKKVFVGFPFDKHGAVEFGYVDLGKYTASASGMLFGLPATASGDFKAKGFNLAFVGSLPVSNEFSILGKFGLFRWDLEADAIATVPSVSASNSESVTDIDLTFGVGAQYDFSKSVGARVEWERFKTVGDKDKTGQSDIDLLSIGVVFKF